MNNDSMNCEDIKEIIENLSPQTSRKTEQEPFREHLNKCSECRQLYEETLSLNNLLDQWETPKSKVNLQSRIMAKIAQIEEKRVHPIQPVNFWGQLRLLLGYQFPVPAFAVILLMVFLCGSLAVNLLLLGRSPGSGMIANNIDKGGSRVPTTGNFVQDDIEPGSKQSVVKEPTFVYVAENGHLKRYEDAIQAGVVQPVIIVILGAPPVLPGRPDFSSEHINNVNM